VEEVVKVAKELIAKDEIEAVLGYEKGRAPFQNVPFFARTEKDCERLVLNPLCLNNLATYIRDFKGKVAVFAKPCDAKAIVGLIQEKQIDREKIHIIGINCPGVVNPKALIKAMKGKKVEDWSIKENKISIKAGGENKELPLKDFLMDKCISCEERSPGLYDDVIGKEITVKTEVDEFARIKELEKLSPEEKQKYWNEHFAKCIRCYACIKSCPLCYCEKCFVDTSIPQWIHKSVDIKSNKAFHIIRAFHLAGRCIGCGECDRACPVDIPLKELNRKMSRSVIEHFDYVPGKDHEVPPPLSTFKKEDHEDFIR